jgi:hypothetical protein
MNLREKRRGLLALEQLENRLVPASVTYFNGNLVITPSAGELAMNLTVKQTGVSNTFSVTDNGKNLGTYTAVGNIFVTGTNGSDSVTLNLGGLVYSGNFTANSGNGNDSVDVESGGAAGAILGNTLISSGLGTDLVFLNTGAAAGRFGGNITVVGTGESNKLVVLGNSTAPTTVGGNLTITGINIAVLASTGVTDVIQGSVAINDGALGVPAIIAVANVNINKDLTISSGQGNSLVALVFDTVAGNTAVTMGAGNDSVLVNGSGPSNLFGGNLSISGTTGNDTVSFTGTNTIAGNLSIGLGNGTDTISIATGTTVGGDTHLTLGNGNDTILDDAIVNGNAFFSLGAGNDTVTLGHAPAGILSWFSGNGNDLLTLGDGSTAAGEVWNVFMRFGTGNDTLTLGPGGTLASPEALTGFIDMGGPPGGNSFDPTGSLAAGTWITLPPFVLQNV